MITETNVRGVQNGKKLVSLALKSTDSKPTSGVMNGSTCIEVNTGKTYVYDEEGSEWTEISSSGGGGGGGGSSDFSTAEVTFNIGEAIASLQIIVPNVYDDGEVAGANINIIASGTYQIILYKGMAICGISYSGLHTVTVTGDIVDDGGDFYITGNGTITIS